MDTFFSRRKYEILHSRSLIPSSARISRRYPGALLQYRCPNQPLPITRSQAILYSFQSSLIRSITKARSLGMFGTAKENQEGLQKSQGFVDEIQADSYDRLWTCKLSMFLMQRPLRLLLPIILARSMAYSSIPKSQKYLNRLKLFPNGAIAATTWCCRRWRSISSLFPQ